MFCKKCGNQLPDDARFCNKCGNNTAMFASAPTVSDAGAPPVSAGAPPLNNAGTPQAQTEAPQGLSEKAPVPSSVKIYIIVAAAAVVIAGVVLLLINLNSRTGTPSMSGSTRTASDSGSGSSRQGSDSGSSSSRQDSGGTSSRSSSRDDYDEDDFSGTSGGRGGISSNFTLARDSLVFFSTWDNLAVSVNNNPKFNIPGEMQSCQLSIDGSKAALLMNYQGNYGGELWFVTTTDSYLIADDVVAYLLSHSGDGVAYMKDYDDWYQSATLFLYDTTAKTSTTVARDAFYSGYSGMPGVCISPNGKSLGYITDYDERYEEFTGYTKVDGGTAEKLGNNEFALAISDGGRYLYCVKIGEDGYDASLIVRSGRSDVTLVPYFISFEGLMLNRDYSEVVYTYDGNTFISRSGNEGQKVLDSRIHEIIMPQGAQRSFMRSFIGNVVFYGIGSFGNVTALTDNGLVYINGKLEATNIPDSSYYETSAVISNDGRTLLYKDNRMRLIAADPTRDSADGRVVAENVQTFAISNDARYIYYVNELFELWFVRDNRDPEKISDDVYPSHLVTSYNSSLLFFLVDYDNYRGGELYYSDNGGRREKVSGANEVLNIRCTPTSAFFVNLDNEVYRSGGNGSFALFERDVMYQNYRSNGYPLNGHYFD